MNHTVSVEQVAGAAIPVDEILAICEAATATDGVEALGEQPIRALRDRSAEVLHLVARDGDAFVGYAQLDRRAQPVAEMVVDPGSRRHGAGRSMLTALVALAPEVAVWAHGDLPAARALAAASGMHRTRELLRMRRDGLAGPVIEEVRPPAGIEFGTLAEADSRWPGMDAVGGLLEVNNASFSWHPEQGGWTRRQLEERLAVDWVDPTGVFLAVETGDPGPRVVGFHWTKVHPAPAGEPAVGEVYVVGVDPGQQGRRLGTSLTRLGVRHLEESGVAAVILYVEGDNVPARRTYERLGFVVDHVDTTYSGGV